jgi:hypothetical protein
MGAGQPPAVAFHSLLPQLSSSESRAPSRSHDKHPGHLFKQVVATVVFLFLLSVSTAAAPLRCSLPPSLSRLWLEQLCQLFRLSRAHLVDPFASANFAQSVRAIASSPSPATEHRQAASRGQPLPELLRFNRSRFRVRGMPLEQRMPSSRAAMAVGEGAGEGEPKRLGLLLIRGEG